MQMVCKMFPEGSRRRLIVALGTLLAILLSLAVSLDRGWHREFHRGHAAGHSGAESCPDHSSCDSDSCAAGSFEKGLVQSVLLWMLLCVVVGWLRPLAVQPPSSPYYSPFRFLLPDRGPPGCSVSFSA